VIANTLGAIFVGSVIFLLKLEYISRSFLILFCTINFFVLALERSLLIYSWRKLASSDFFKRNILIVGTGPRARIAIRMLQSHPEWGLGYVGILDEDPSLVGKFVEGVPVIGVLDDLNGMLENHVVDEVFFVVPRSWLDRIEDKVLYCEHVGVKATVAIDLFNIRFAKAVSSDIEGKPLITFDATPIGQWQLMIKNIGDMTAAIICLVLLSPIFLITMMLIKWTSPGPIFFKQIRCGLNGRRFMLFKFRSMDADAEGRQDELNHLNELDGPVFKVANDPRLTPIGRILRKTSIDELPQIINVIKGDMSLVGPRPPVPKEVALYKPWQRRRLSMRPGITGNWQVNGRNNITDFNHLMRFDLEYIDRWSLLLDMKIMLKTIPAVLSGSGAK